MSPDFWDLPLEQQQATFYGLEEAPVDDISELWPLRFSVRIFPLDADEAEALKALLVDVSCMSRILPKRGDRTILLIDIDSATSASRIKDVLDGRFGRDGLDIFVSWLPERDSMIAEVPEYVVDLIAHFRCRLYYSFTWVD